MSQSIEGWPLFRHFLESNHHIVDHLELSFKLFCFCCHCQGFLLLEPEKLRTLYFENMLQHRIQELYDYTGHMKLIVLIYQKNEDNAAAKSKGSKSNSGIAEQ